MDASKFVGWYDAPHQTRPAHVPPDDAPCPVCDQALGPRDDARYITLMYPGSPRSLFYGIHQGCADAPRQHIDEAVLDWSERN